MTSHHISGEALAFSVGPGWLKSSTERKALPTDLTREEITLEVRSGVDNKEHSKPTCWEVLVKRRGGTRLYIWKRTEAVREVHLGLAALGAKSNKAWVMWRGRQSITSRKIERANERDCTELRFWENPGTCCGMKHIKSRYTPDRTNKGITNTVRHNIHHEDWTKRGVRGTYAPMAAVDLRICEVLIVLHQELGQKSSVRQELPDYRAILWVGAFGREGRGGIIGFRPFIHPQSSRIVVLSSSPGIRRVRNDELAEGDDHWNDPAEQHRAQTRLRVN